MDIEKAIEFVRLHGSNFEKARLSSILGEEFEVEEVLGGFSGIQNPDGGYPFGDIPGFPSSLSNTAMALHTLEDLGLSDSEPAKRAIDFLMGHVNDDGSWSENEKLLPLDPPEWDMPKDADTTLWLTADIADILLRMDVSVPKRTCRFLKRHQKPDGKFDGYEHTTWMALSVFSENGFDDRSVHSSALAYLEGTEIDDWDASRIAWCLRSMRHGNVGEKSLLWERLLGRLTATQEEDGSWPNDDGEHLKARDVNSVLAAVR